MAYSGIQMFMEKLKQLINSNDIPFFNYPEIICERPQFQLLYDDLSSMGQPLFIHQHQDLHDPEKVKDLRTRFIDAAEEAQYIVDLFLSGVHIRNSGHTPTSGDFNRSLHLDDVRRSLKSVEGEFMSIHIHRMKIDSSQRPERTLNQPAPAQVSITRNSIGSKKILDEIIVGLDRDAERIGEKLLEDEEQVQIVSIVGMGGIGKTTLANKVFTDTYFETYFNVRVWVTVSQTYDKRSVLIKILESLHAQLDLENTSDSQLHVMVRQHLFRQRYLIVIDDIWNIETWDNLKMFFPHDNTRSRIILTSRFTEVAKHAKPDGYIHHLGCMDNEKSWELLRKKVFHGNDCPQWANNPGMQIVESCQGLPLAVVVIAGVLAKDAWSEKFWVEIAYTASSHIVGDENGCLKTLALSYNHLPFHLRECFLYFGRFPEDYKFQVKRLLWLWVAEGFIQQDGNKSLEDIAEGYLLELIDRNLVTVTHMSTSGGAVKVCILHDLVRELCLKTAVSSHVSNITARPYKVARLFINNDIQILGFPYPSAQNLRSILGFSDFTPLRDDIAKYFCSFVLLSVLDLQKCRLNNFPKGMELLVHLRYLAIWNSSADFPPSICNLWTLQTLIYITGQNVVVLPSNISDLVNLRHLCSYSPPVKAMKFSIPFVLPSIGKTMKLQTISNVELQDGVINFQKCFPYIKQLTCTTNVDGENDFQSLECLEKLNLTTGPRSESICGKIDITFPLTLKTLTLAECRLPWSDMSILQSLPKLQVLKLHRKAFEGSCWNTDEQEFRQLNFLRLEWLDIKLWEAYTPSSSFPCLRQLEIFCCRDLEEIPIEIGDTPSLQLIRIKDCSPSLDESVKRIQDLGIQDLKIDILKDK